MRALLGETLKINGWNMTFSFGMAYFQGASRANYQFQCGSHDPAE